MGIFTDIIYKKNRQQEVEKSDIIFLEKIDKDNGLYELACKHIKKISFRNAKIGNFKCVDCWELMIREEAISRGIECIDEKVSGSYNNYKFKACGHIKKLSVNNIKNSKKNITCEVCFDKYLKECADKNNLMILNKKCKSSARVCLFKCCGQEKVVELTSLKNKVRCNLCHINKVNDYVESVSRLSINKEKKSDKKAYRFFTLPCGHEKFMSMRDAVLNKFICRKCNVSKLDLPSYVYLLKLAHEGFEWLKLGYGSNVDQRIKEYGLDKNTNVEILYKIETKTGAFARDFEKSLHSKYLNIRLNIKTMKKYMKISGFSECYNVSEFTTLYNELITFENKKGK